jgi:ribonuclease HII
MSKRVKGRTSGLLVPHHKSLPGELERAFQGRYPALLGVDEAGRGALCGPVIAAAVALPADCELTGLDDSKKLAEAKRRQLDGMIRTSAVCFGIGSATAAEVDNLNVLQATFLAMRRAIHRALTSTDWQPDLILVDGPYAIPELMLPQKPEVRGDARSLNIAAASIVAKTVRDNMMREFHKTHPEYGFDRHVGYGTAQHREAIHRLGLTPHHRKTFRH